MWLLNYCAPFLSNDPQVVLVRKLLLGEILLLFLIYISLRLFYLCSSTSSTDAAPKIVQPDPTAHHIDQPSEAGALPPHNALQSTPVKQYIMFGKVYSKIMVECAFQQIVQTVVRYITWPSRSGSRQLHALLPLCSANGHGSSLHGALLHPPAVRSTAIPQVGNCCLCAHGSDQSVPAVFRSHGGGSQQVRSLENAVQLGNVAVSF